MQKYLKVFFVLFIIVPKCSLSLNSNVDRNNIQEKIAANEAELRKLELEIEHEEKQLNFEKAKLDYQNVILNLENKFKECEAQAKDRADNTLSKILHEIKNIQSNAQDNESKLKEKDEIIANLTTQLSIQSKAVNLKINQITEAKIADLKNQIQNKDIEIQHLKLNISNADLKLKEYDCQIKSLESNILSYKSSIDKRNAEISKLELSIKQNKLQPIASKDLNISLSQLQTNLSICSNQLTNSQQEKTKLTSQLQEKDNIINETKNELKKCELDNLNSKQTNGNLQRNLDLCQTCESDLNKLKNEFAQKEVRTESFRRNAEDTQKLLNQCQSDNMNCKTKIEDKDKALQKNDNERKSMLGELSDCQNKLNEVNKQIQDIFYAKSNLSRCIEISTANQNKLNVISNELRDCKGREKKLLEDKQQSAVPTIPTRSLPNTCLSSTVGIQEIKLDNYESFEVPCEYGWMIIQRRLGGNVNFNESWDVYEAGFGDWQGELFLGLEKLHLITYSRPYELKIRIIDRWNREFTAEYDNFQIGNLRTDYKIESLGNFKGNSYDSMRGNENMKFSTYDKNFGNCAKKLGGWWFTAYCGQSNLNSQNNVRWLYNNTNTNKLAYVNYKFVYMMIRPKPE